MNRPLPLPLTLRGTGHYAPKEVLTNDFFADYLDTSDEWITSRTGIHSRHRAAPDETTSTLATHAAQRALTDAGMSADELDLIIVCTATPDTPVPSTACYVQTQLGLTNIPVFDINAACSGFAFGLVVAANMVNTGCYKNIMVIGAETLTRITNFEDRNTAVLFGDAAGAAIISASTDPNRGLLFHRLGTDGSRAHDIWMPGGGSAQPASHESVDQRRHYLHMNGREVYKFAVKKMRELIDEAMQVTGLKPEELKMVIPHQSNLRIIESVREKLGLPLDKIAINIDKFGNTSAASVIVALDESRQKGLLQEGDVILLVVLGAGLTWGAVVWRL